jgi:hypothetical protein
MRHLVHLGDELLVCKKVDYSPNETLGEAFSLGQEVMAVRATRSRSGWTDQSGYRIDVVEHGGWVHNPSTELW